MKTVILCAGHGKRMLPYTITHQKAMLPVHGKPLLEYIITGLIQANLKDFILVVGYRKEQVMNYFKDGSRWNVNIEYIEQQDLNGTGGALLLCESSITDNHFFLVWGDVLVPYRIYKMTYDLFKKEKHDFIMVSNYKEDLSKSGAIYCEGDFCLEIIEKEPTTSSSSKLNNCGIFVLSSEIFKILKQITPSKRDEIELPSALNYGIKTRNWRIFVIKLDENVFRGDFGDKSIYEKLKVNSEWLNELIN